MNLVRFRSVARWLLAVSLALLLLWLALPRLLGLAAERWLAIPGLQALHVDIEKVGAGHARLREVRAVYQSDGGHTLRIALHGIALDYSLAGRRIERLDIASGELDIFPGQAPPGSPWPRLEWPHLPFGEAQLDDLRIAVHRPERPPLQANGHLSLRQTEGAFALEFRLDADLLRVTASQAQLPGNTLEIRAEWLPAVGPVADARLHIGLQPAKQAARLAAQVPLPVLAKVASALDVSIPITAAGGSVALTAEALLGEAAGTLRAFSGEAEFVDARMQGTGTASPPGRPVDVELAGKLRFAWQPLTAEVELQPGLRWQVTVEGEPSLQASGRLDRAYAVRRDNGVALSEGEFPFVVRSSQWGQWDGAVLRARLNGEPGLADWRTADTKLRIKGQLKQWRQDAIQVRELRAAGDVVLHWSQPGELVGNLALQVGIDGLSWSGDSPLSVAKSTWKVKAEAAAKADGDFWKSLSLQGEASSPQLKVKLDSGQALTLGLSHLQLLQLRLADPQSEGVQGELLLAADSIRIGTWPAPDLRTRLHLDAGTLRGDGTLLLQETEVLRFAGSHALARGCGEATLTTQQALRNLGKLLQPRPSAQLPLDFIAGEADARFTMDWCTRPNPRFDAKGTLQVRDATLGWEHARLDALQTKLQLDGLHPARGRIQLAAQRGELATGTPLADLNVDLALASQALTVYALSVNLLGGRVHSAPLSVPWPPSGQALPLEVRHLDLGQLLAMLDVQGLSGSGQLGGVLPLVYRDAGVEIHDGQLSSVGPGTIKYAPALTIPDNPGLQALRNFHFRQLGMHAWYASDGVYRTQATLEGNNPDFYDGYPIRFGLNINGKLPGLFRSALFSGDFNRHILEQLQSGKLE